MRLEIKNAHSMRGGGAQTSIAWLMRQPPAHRPRCASSAAVLRRSRHTPCAVRPRRRRSSSNSTPIAAADGTWSVPATLRSGGLRLGSRLNRHPAVIDFNDPIGQRQRALTVRDHDHRPAAADFGQRVVDQAFAIDVDLARGFVENQNFGISQDGAGQGDPLPLAAAQALAVRADDRSGSRRESC